MRERLTPARGALAAGGRRSRSLLAGARRCGCGASRHGLPYVYNADENAHFVPRRDRDVRALATTRTTSSTRPRSRTCCTSSFGVWFGGRDGVSRARSRPTRRRSSRSRAADRGAARDARRRAAVPGRARGCSTARVGLLAGGAAGRRVPAGLLRAPRAQRRADARAGRACRCSASPASLRRGAPLDYALAGVGPRARVRDEVHRRASCSLPLLAAAAHPVAQAPDGAGAALGLAGRGASWRSAAFLVANPYALLDFDAFRDGPEPPVRRGRRRRRASSASTQDSGHPLLPVDARPGGWAGCPRSPRSAARSLLPATSRGSRSCSSPRRRSSCSSWARRSASSARWLLPVYPLPVPARRATRSSSWRASWRARRPRAGAGRAALAVVLLCAQGARLRRSTTTACSPAPTRATRPRLDGRPRARGHEDRGRAGGARRVGADIGHPSPATGERRALGQVADEPLATSPTTARSCPGPGAIVNIEDYERTLYPGARRPLRAAAATAGWSPARRSAGAPRSEPGKVPERAAATTASWSAAARLVYQASPFRRGAKPVAVQLRLDLQLLPAGLRPAGAGHAHLPPAGRQVRAGTRLHRGPCSASRPTTSTSRERSSSRAAAWAG